MRQIVVFFFGGATGLLAGLAAAVIAPAGVAVGGAAMLLGTTVAGVSYGAFVSALVGSSVPNSQLREFEELLEKG